MGQCRIGEIPNPYGEGCLPDVAYHAKKTSSKKSTKKEPVKSKTTDSKKRSDSYQKRTIHPFCKELKGSSRDICKSLQRKNLWIFNVKLTTPSMDLKGPKKGYEPRKTDAAAIYKQDRTLKIDVSRRKTSAEPTRSPSTPQRLGGSRKP